MGTVPISPESRALRRFVLVRNGGEDERLRAGAGGERDKQAGGS